MTALWICAAIVHAVERYTPRRNGFEEGAMDTLIGFLVGMFLGSLLGVFLMCLLVAAASKDEELEEWDER